MYYPIKLKPVYKDYMWGGRYFEKFDRELPDGVLAESWELSSHKNGISVILNGELQGKSLLEAISADTKNLLGTKFSENTIEIPLLIKFIDSKYGLSVQVHPDDSYASVYEGGHGKNELWYVLNAEPGAGVIAGVKPGISKEVFIKAIEENKVEDCLLKTEVKAGDVISVPAGLVHSIGAGIVIVEIQQTSDITYRVYDFNRVDNTGCKRQLHLDKALEVIDFNTRENVKCEGTTYKVNNNCIKTVFLANRHFVCERYDVNGSFSEECDGIKFFVFVFIEGEGTLETSNTKIKFKAGETVFLPAAMGKYKVDGVFKALKTYIPDIRKDIIEPMRKGGCTNKDIFRILS